MLLFRCLGPPRGTVLFCHDRGGVFVVYTFLSSYALCLLGRSRSQLISRALRSGWAEIAAVHAASSFKLQASSAAAAFRWGVRADVWLFHTCIALFFLSCCAVTTFLRRCVGQGVPLRVWMVPCSRRQRALALVERCEAALFVLGGPLHTHRRRFRARIVWEGDRAATVTGAMYASWTFVVSRAEYVSPAVGEGATSSRNSA